MSYKHAKVLPYFKTVSWTKEKNSHPTNYFRRHEMPVSIFSDSGKNLICYMYHPLMKEKHYYALSRHRHQFFTVIK